MCSKGYIVRQPTPEMLDLYILDAFYVNVKVLMDRIGYMIQNQIKEDQTLILILAFMLFYKVIKPR